MGPPLRSGKQKSENRKPDFLSSRGRRMCLPCVLEIKNQNSDKSD